MCFFRVCQAREVFTAKLESLDQRCNVPFIHSDAVKYFSAASVICPAVGVHLINAVLSLLCVCATQGSHGEKGKLGLPGIKGDTVGFQYVWHPVGIINLVKHI